MGPVPDPLSDTISVSCSHALVIPYFVQIFSRYFHGKFPSKYHTCLLDRNDDHVVRNPVMRIMGAEPDFVACHLVQLFHQCGADALTSTLTRHTQIGDKQPVGEIRDAEADTDDGAYFVSCHKADRSPVD